ncbi:MAG: DUF962 domain-containing protein [Phycisphaerae bacterium]
MGNPISNWRRRHQNPISFWLHMVGIPACFVAAPVLLVLRQWWAALACFVGGYILQFVGHWVEGNRSGEEMLLRRLLRVDREDGTRAK